MKSTASSSLSSGGLGRVALFYVVLGVVLVLAVQYVPIVRTAVSGERLSELGQGELAQLLGAEPLPPVGPVSDPTPWADILLAVISMLGALAIMVPVTWVYMITRRNRGYHESVVHTLLILPIAVTAIVMIVQNSVALAFSLAGIVAAVRFRTTLDDTKDAVYVFLAIGVGLASGVQALGIAIVLSVVFNGLVLVLWRTQFGNIYAKNARGRPLSRADIVAGPGSAPAALRVGDPAVLDAASPADHAEILDRAVRMERVLSEERTKKKSKRVNTLILVHAQVAEPARAFVDPLLEEMATRFKLIEVGHSPKGFILEYIARLDGPGVQTAFMDRLGEAHGGVVDAAELRSLKGLKPQL